MKNWIEERKDNKLTNIIFTIWLLIISVSIFSFIVRTEINYIKQNNAIKYNDSLYKDLYYSIIDSTEKEGYLVTLTTYEAKIGQTDNTPLITASNFKINPKLNNRFIALSKDLLEEFHYGELIKLENAGNFNGIYVVMDAMNPRLIRHVDILISNSKNNKLKNVVLKHYNSDK